MGFSLSLIHILGQDVRLEAVALVEHVDSRRLLRAQLSDELFHHVRLGAPLLVAGVNDVEQQVSILQFFQGGLERLHQVVGQLADEAHGVGQERCV